MILNVAKPSIETPQIDLSKLGVSLPAQALQQIVDAVTIAITPAVVRSLEQQIEQKVEFCSSVITVIFFCFKF